MGLKIRGKGDEDAPLFVTGLYNITGTTEMDISTVMDSVTDSVTAESTASDECYGCDSKTYNLLNVETKLAQIEQYTTAVEKELREKENLDKEPSTASPEQAKTIDTNKLQVNIPTAKKPSPTVIKEEDKGLKVGDRVIYVGKKYRESIGNQVMEVVKISVHWTGNQVTCKYNKGWTTWLAESSLKKV